MRFLRLFWSQKITTSVNARFMTHEPLFPANYPLNAGPHHLNPKVGQLGIFQHVAR